MEGDGERTDTAEGSGWDALMRAAERERLEEEGAKPEAPAPAPAPAGEARGAVTRSELFGLRALRDRLRDHGGDQV